MFTWHKNFFATVCFVVGFGAMAQESSTSQSTDSVPRPILIGQESDVLDLIEHALRVEYKIDNVRKNYSTNPPSAVADFFSMLSNKTQITVFLEKVIVEPSQTDPQKAAFRPRIEVRSVRGTFTDTHVRNVSEAIQRSSKNFSSVMLEDEGKKKVIDAGQAAGDVPSTVEG